MDNLFGMEITGAVRFLIAFVVVLALIALTAWLVRRFGSGALASAGGRGRQPRLAVIDAAAVDTRRKLILVRRDNVEHLLMIGGPTDVVVEANIVRSAPAAREAPAVRTAPVSDMMPRPVPREPEMTWPPIPAEPVTRPRRPAPSVVAKTVAAPSPANGAGRAQHPDPDALAELSDGLTTPTPPHIDPAPPLEPDGETPYATPANDPHLAEMAQRLETAVNRPADEEPNHDAPTTAPTAEAKAEHADAETRNAEHPEIPEVRPPVSAEPNPRESKKLYETLEQEMASLLGRPTGKT